MDEYDLSYAVLMFRGGEGRIFRLEEGWPVGIITDMIPIVTTQGLFDLFDVLLSAPVKENTGFNILRNDGNRVVYKNSIDARQVRCWWLKWMVTRLL